MRSTSRPVTASSRSSGALSASASTLGGLEVARFGDRLPHLGVQALDQPAVGLAVGIGVAVLREKVCRRLVFAARDELRLDAGLVERVAQEQRVGGEADQPDGARRLHPHLAERRRQVVRQRAGIGLGPRQRRLDVAEGRDGRRAAPAPDPPRRPGICTRAISPATRGSSAARWMAATASRSSSGLPPLAIIASGSKPAGLRRHRLQIEFEHAAVGHTVVTGGVDPPGQCAHVVGRRGCRAGRKNMMRAYRRGVLARAASG